ncbi:MAG: thioesterase family protein [Bacteroidota bacterium]
MPDKASSPKHFITYLGAVQTWQCDSNRHMNVMYYVNKYELAGRQMISRLGFTQEVLQAHQWGIVVVKQEIDYHKEAFEDTLLRIESCLVKIGVSSFTIQHDMRKVETGERVGKALITMAAIDLTMRKAVRLKASIKQQMEKILVS